MHTTTLLRALLRNDAKLIGRDSFLVMMFGFVVVITLVMRFGLPALNDSLIVSGVMPGGRITKPLEAYYPLIIGYFAFFQGALIGGTIFGFAMLNEKDDNTLRAMLVTPIPVQRYMLYRVIVPTLCSFFIILFMFWGTGLELIAPIKAVLIAAAGSLTSPIAALYYGLFADNKVQGFAISKFAGVAGWVILFGWFVPEPWQWILGIFPPFWITKSYWMAWDGNASWWIALVLGVLTQIVLIAIMAKAFNRMAYK